MSAGTLGLWLRFFFKSFLSVLFALTMVACGKGGDSPTPTPVVVEATCPQVDGIACKKQQGFVDVSFCDIDLHVVPGQQVYVCGGNAYSATDNSKYVKSTDGTYSIMHGSKACSFTVVNGQLQGVNQ